MCVRSRCQGPKRQGQCLFRGKSCCGQFVECENCKEQRSFIAVFSVGGHGVCLSKDMVYVPLHQTTLQGCFTVIKTLS